VKEKRSDNEYSPLKTDKDDEAFNINEKSTKIVSNNLERSDLHTSVCNGWVEIVNEIIQSLSSTPDKTSTLTDLINATDPNGFTPLHAAVTLISHEKGHENISTTMTKILINAGAVVGCIDNIGNSALHWAARAGSVDTVNVLLLEGCSVGK
jgi:ankyrin repeat protein